MAKGRKLTTSRSERFLGTYAYAHSQGSGDPSELREEDIWSTADDAGDRDSNVSNGDWEPPHAAGESNGGSSVRSRRRIPRDRDHHHHVGGLSLAFEDPASNTAAARIVHQFRTHEGLASSTPRGGRQVATSAPVNVPDWSKILRVDSVESLHDADDDLDENDLEMVPPHEYLARSRKMAANSVFEGVGRTLKGRDLSRVRDAVWSQTGFDG
ncbi:Senescence regulator S40 [Sesbania bispinosa]|nr:Senescence regulator S40 [Sesbania bispinosa]